MARKKAPELADWLEAALIALAIVFFGGLLISGSRGGSPRACWACSSGVPADARQLALAVQLRRMILVGVLFTIVVGLIAGGALVQKCRRCRKAAAPTGRRSGASLTAIRQSPGLGWGSAASPTSTASCSRRN